MKYVSEVTNKVYDTAEEVEAAEKEYAEKQKAEDKKKAERAERAKEVQEAYQAVDEARKAADDLLEKFLKDYGSYYTTVTTKPCRKRFGIFDDLFDDFFNVF